MSIQRTMGPWMVLLMIVMMASCAQAQRRAIYENSLGVSSGIYASEGFGSNLYYGLRFNHYFSRWQFFVEGSIGRSSIKSQVLKDLAAFQVFGSERLTTYEFLMGYDQVPTGSLPYVVFGVAGLNQGGQSKFSYIFGLGKHIPLAKYINMKRWGFRYDIRDQIFQQQVNNDDTFTAHNLMFTMGLQYYF